jgi:hypothetical protein
MQKFDLFDIPYAHSNKTYTAENRTEHFNI